MCKRVSKCGRVKNKKIGLCFQNIGRSQKVFEPDPNSKNSPKRLKNSPKGPKKAQKRPKMWQNQKQKYRAVPPNQSWLLNLTPTPKIAQKRPKKCQKTPIVAEWENKKIGFYFHTINHASQVFFKENFLGFVDAPVMCIFSLIYLRIFS